MAETVYRLLQGDGAQIVEDAAAKTVTISVPALSSKLNVGDVVQATEAQAGIAELSTAAEVQAGTDTSRIVTPAGLAAAAQTSASDATASRLMRVGAFGLGGSAVALASPNLNTEIQTGFYYCQSPQNSPGVGDGWLTHRDHATSGFAAQTFEAAASGRMFFRRQNTSTWSAWLELYHTGNFDPSTKANTSGTYSGLVVGNSAQLNGQTDAMLAPPGMVATFAGSTPPGGWLSANGAAVSRTTYANLFTAIGTTYGAGNGSSTFNLPDARGLFFRALDLGRGIDSSRAIGTTQNSDNLSHSHTASSGSAGSHAHTTSTTGAHVHTPLYLRGSSADSGDPGGLVITESAQDNGLRSMTDSTTASAGDHSHTVSSAADHSHSVSLGSSGGTESRPINIAFLACVKY